LIELRSYVPLDIK